VRRAVSVVMLLAALLQPGCRRPDPQQELELLDLETYWAIDSSLGERQYIAPVARFRLRNKGQAPVRTAEATATFRRKGEEQLDWGTAWERVTPAAKPLDPGQAVLVVLKSDGRYYSSGDPQSFFAHAQFKDARVTVYARVGSSQWVKFAEREVERRIGTRSLEAQKP
jgi:hypothetical protein